MDAAAAGVRPVSERQFQTATCPPAENTSLGPLSRRVLPSLFKLYDLSAGPTDYDIYNVNARFEDPLMRAAGIKQIKSAFYSMQVLFAEAGIKEYAVSETITNGSTGQVVMDNVQHYKVLGREFDVVSRVELQLVDGLVVSHEDLWDKKALATAKTRGIFGWMAEGCRSVNMATTHVLMGFGRDLKPRRP